MAGEREEVKFEHIRAWFEYTCGFRLRPEVTEISMHELYAAAELSPRFNDGLGGRGVCSVCWSTGTRHDIKYHVSKYRHRQGTK